jgi:hypothetical protein
MNLFPSLWMGMTLPVVQDALAWSGGEMEAQRQTWLPQVTCQWGQLRVW